MLLQASNLRDRLWPNAATQTTTSRIACLQSSHHGFDKYGHGVRMPHLTRAERQRLPRQQRLLSSTYIRSVSFLFFLWRTCRAPLPEQSLIPKCRSQNEPVHISCVVPVGGGRCTLHSLSPDCDQPLWAATVATLQDPSSTQLKLIALWELAIHILNFAGCDEELILQLVLHAEPQNWQPTATPRSDGHYQLHVGQGWPFQ